MPTAPINGTTIAYAEAGEGYPLIWHHEFAGSMESWKAQAHFFSRRYRVITFNARGYPPSGVPEDAKAYSEDQAVEDMFGLLKHLGIDQAYIGGLSMGGTAALHFGRKHPEMSRALIVASAGTGATDAARFRPESLATAARIESEGMSALKDYGLGPTRVQLRRKDPMGWQEFADLLAAHSPAGAANTLRGVQAGRRPVFEYEDELRKLDIPTLIMLGDEDEPCIDPSVFLKRTLPRAGLVTFPQCGHAINLEEPAAFNAAVLDFLTAVEAGKWSLRDPGSGVGWLAGR